MTADRLPPPSPRFLRGLQANLRYWQTQTAVLNDAIIRDLDPDFPNLLRAVEMGLAMGEMWPDTAVLILQCFFWVEGSGRVPQWRPLLKKCLTVMPAPDDWVQFRLLKQLGQLQRIQWDLETAVNTFHQAGAIAQTLQDDQAIAEMHMNLCQTLHRQHHYAQAEQEGQAALALFDQSAIRERTVVWQSLGHIAKEQGDLPAAKRHFQKALTIVNQQETISVTDKTRTMNALATIYQEEERFAPALQLYRETADLLAHTTKEQDKIEVQINQGSLFYSWGKLEQAEAAFRQAERMLKRQKGLASLKALVANNLGCVLRDSRTGAAAEYYYRQSAALYRQIGDDLMLANAVGNLAKLYRQQAQFVDAQRCFDEALALVARFPDNAWARTLQAQYAEKTAELARMQTEKGLTDVGSANPY